MADLSASERTKEGSGLCVAVVAGSRSASFVNLIAVPAEPGKT